MVLPIYQVDAFAEDIFKGNPAAVMPLERWLDDELLAAIAMENNLSETAYVVKVDNGFELRWFTPQVEVDLCGHATLAAAHVLSDRLFRRVGGSPGTSFMGVPCIASMLWRARRPAIWVLMCSGSFS